MYLVDSNLLLRSAEPAHPMYSIAVNAQRYLSLHGETLVLVPQNLYEFWNVCTRPTERNGLAKTVAETEREILRLERLFPLLPDSPQVYIEWRKIVYAYNVIGVSVHDARLVAAMKVHGISHILTFNDKDFKRYSDINAINPADITL